MGILVQSAVSPRRCEEDTQNIRYDNVTLSPQFAFAPSGMRVTLSYLAEHVHLSLSESDILNRVAFMLKQFVLARSFKQEASK